MEEDPTEKENVEEDSGSNKLKHPVPLAPIKRIMRCDDNVNKIAPDAAVVFSKACELFITDLSQRAWAQAEIMQKKQLQHNDVCAVIQKTDVFDFLFDILPRDDKEMRD